MSTPFYIYGITRGGSRTPITASPVGVGRDVAAATLTDLPIGSVSALVSPIETMETRRTRRNMLAHTRILEAAMEQGPVLPMCFGAVAETADVLADVLAPRSDEFLSLLDRFEGHHELGVRVRWDREACLKNLIEVHPELRARHAAANGPGGYQAKIELGRLVADLIETWRKEQERALLDRLKPLAGTYALKAPEEDIEVLRADFLVTEAQEAAVTEALDAWRIETGAPAEISCIAPAPIYHFVSLRLDLPVDAEMQGA